MINFSRSLFDVLESAFSLDTHKEVDDNILTIYVPGYHPNTVKATIEVIDDRNILVVQANSKPIFYKVLGNHIDVGSIKAKLEFGILTIELKPKEIKKKSIEIKIDK